MLCIMLWEHRRGTAIGEESAKARLGVTGRAMWVPCVWKSGAGYAGQKSWPEQGQAVLRSLR